MTKLSNRQITKEIVKLCDAMQAEDERHRKAMRKLLKRGERLEALAANKAYNKSSAR